MATHSSILAWKSPWTEEPGGLYSMGLYGKERRTHLQGYSDISWEAERNTRESSNSYRPFFTPTADLGVSSTAPRTDSTAFTPLR